MTWIETDSLSFTARHDDSDTGCAQRTLDRLEDVRLKLEERFDRAPGDVTVVIHDNPAWLSAAHPLLPAVRWAAAPAARRYLAGWPMLGEIHVLNDYWIERRAAGEDSLIALKKNGVPEKVIEAIMSPSAAPAVSAAAPAPTGNVAMAPPPAMSSAPSRPTVFLIVAGKEVELIASGAEIQKNNMRYSRSTELVIAGNKAKHRTAERQPVFVITSAPAEMALVRLDPGKNDRNLKIGSGSRVPYGGSSSSRGIRSEDMEDAALTTVPAERRVTGKVTLTEALGSQIIVHFTFPGDPVVTEDTKLVAQDPAETERHVADDAGVKWVASFAPRSRVSTGDVIEIAVDVERAHFFDPETSLTIRD